MAEISANVQLRTHVWVRRALNDYTGKAACVADHIGGKYGDKSSFKIFSPSAMKLSTIEGGSYASAEQQSVLTLHRARELLVRQRTILVNAICAHMAEFAIVAPVGLLQVKELLSTDNMGQDHT